MNPWDWEWRHRVALFVSTGLGALIGLVVGYQSTGTRYSAFDWLFDFGYGEFQIPEAAWWLAFGAIVGGGIFYVWRISAIPLPPPKVAAATAQAVPMETRAPSIFSRSLRELAAIAAFFLTFSVVCLPLVLFRQSLDRSGLDAVPFPTDASGAALFVGIFAAVTGLFGLALGRWAYDRVRVKPSSEEMHAAGSLLPKWIELLLSIGVAVAILAIIALVVSN